MSITELWKCFSMWTLLLLVRIELAVSHCVQYAYNKIKTLS